LGLAPDGALGLAPGGALRLAPNGALGLAPGGALACRGTNTGKCHIPYSCYPADQVLFCSTQGEMSLELGGAHSPDPRHLHHVSDPSETVWPCPQLWGGLAYHSPVGGYRQSALWLKHPSNCGGRWPPPHSAKKEISSVIVAIHHATHQQHQLYAGLQSRSTRLQL
jgi:hypothetical protein